MGVENKTVCSSYTFLCHSFKLKYLLVVVQLLSHVRLLVPMDSSTPSCSICPPLSLSVCQIHDSVMPSNRLILCCPLLLLPSIFPTIRVFSGESALCIRWPKCWSFSVSPSSEYSGLIAFRKENVLTEL